MMQGEGQLISKTSLSSEYLSAKCNLHSLSEGNWYSLGPLPESTLLLRIVWRVFGSFRITWNKFELLIVTHRYSVTVIYIS